VSEISRWEIPTGVLQSSFEIFNGIAVSEPSTLSNTLLEVEPSQGRAMTLLHQFGREAGMLPVLGTIVSEPSTLSNTLLEVEPSQGRAMTLLHPFGRDAGMLPARTYYKVYSVEAECDQRWFDKGFKFTALGG
jgi:hypothetical protein